MAGKHNLKYKFGYLEAPKQAHLIINFSQTRNT